MLKREQKKKIIKKYKLHDADTGSQEVQMAILTEEINQLISHLKKHPKDNSSRRGLLAKVNQRKKLLMYLKKENEKRHASIVKKLKLKG